MTNNVLSTILSTYQQPKKGSEFMKGTKTIFGQDICDDCVLYTVFIQEPQGTKITLTQQFISEKELDIANGQYAIYQCANGIPRLVPKWFIHDVIESGEISDYMMSPMKQVNIS